MEINLNNIYSSYINLSSRPERNERMIKELDRVGIKAERFEAYSWKELWDNGTEEQRYNWGYMHNIRKTPGAIGAWESMISVMKRALEQGKHALILEDDVEFCDDMDKRFPIIFDFLNQQENWSVFWLGGHYHWTPEWHKSINGNHTHHEIKGLCNCTLNKDWEPTENQWINRTYGAFSTMAWIINKDKIQEHIDLMYKHMNYEMGVDHFYIVHQPNMKCYAFNPGCAKQYSSQSNIGNGWSNQDFSSLGEHWFQKSMNYKNQGA